MKGTFRKKRAPKNIFPEMLATGECVGGHLKKIFRTYQKNFPDIPHFFLHMKKCFRIYRKILGKYDIFRGKEKSFPEITYIQVFKSALWAKNAILMTFLKQEKALCSRKKSTWKNLGAWPPGSYAPMSHFTMSHFTILLATAVRA